MAKSKGETNDVPEKPVPIDPAQAQAAIQADAEARAKEFSEIIQREGQRLRCTLEISQQITIKPLG